MKQEHKTPITDEYLNSLTGIMAAEPKNFFYDRLINRLANQEQLASWTFPLKPAWMICTLLVLLLLNTFILAQKDKTIVINPATGIENFASAYDQQISSY